jgi:hypothetical protein
MSNPVADDEPNENDAGDDAVGVATEGGLDRRRYLSTLATAASASIAGCGDIVESAFEGLGEVPQVTLQDARLVQTVDETEVKGASGSPTSLDNPRLVEQYNVAPVVGLTGEKLGNLQSGLDLEIDAGNTTQTFTLSTSDVEDIDAGADPAAVFTEASSGSNTPVVELASGTSSVTVTAKGSTSGATLDSTTISKGSDYSTVGADALRVGFVGVQDPDDGDNFGAGNNGELADFGHSFWVSFQYLVAAYPGGVIGFGYEDGTITADIGNRNNDYSDAYTTLQKAAKGNHNSKPNFPNGGTFHNESHMSDSDAESAIKNDGFDVTVLLVPEGYYGKLGYYPGSRKLAVTTMESKSGRYDEAEVSHTVAQEIAHNLAGDPYTDPSKHPLAQRSSKGSDATVSGTSVDRDHARHRNSNGGSDPPGVTSVGYDLTDGTFTTIDSTDFDATSGDFSIGGNFGSGANRSVGRLESFMSYSWNDVWNDVRMVEKNIDSGYNRSNWGSSSRAVLAGQGRVTAEGAVAFENVVTYEGHAFVPDRSRENLPSGGNQEGEATPTEEGGEATPTEEGGEATPTEEGGETPVETPADGESQTDVPGREVDGEPEETPGAKEVRVELRTPEGTAEVTGYVSDRLRHFHSNEVTNFVSFVLEFPDPVVEVETLREDRTRTFNPITRVVGDAADRVPERGFVEDAAAGRDRIRRALARVDSFMGDQVYGEAAAAMDTDVRSAVSGAIRGEYEDAGSNQPFRADVLDLVDRMVGRLERVGEEY